MATRSAITASTTSFDDLSARRAGRASGAAIAGSAGRPPRRASITQLTRGDRSISRSSGSTSPRGLAGGELPPLRGRPSDLRRLPDRERLPAADAIEPPQGDQPGRTRWARMAKIGQVAAGGLADYHGPPRVKVETAIRQTQGAIGFYSDDLFTSGRDAERGGETGIRRGPPSRCSKVTPRLLKEKVLPRPNGEWRIGAEKFGTSSS